MSACPSTAAVAAAAQANSSLSLCNYVPNDTTCYNVTYASVSVANRCLPVSGTNINVLGLSGDAISSFTSDLVTGYPAIIAAGACALFLGYLWLWLVVWYASFASEVCCFDDDNMKEASVVFVVTVHSCARCL